MHTDRQDTMGWWTESTGTVTESRHPTENPCLLTNMDARYPFILFSLFSTLRMEMQWLGTIFVSHFLLFSTYFLIIYL